MSLIEEALRRVQGFPSQKSTASTATATAVQATPAKAHEPPPAPVPVHSWSTTVATPGVSSSSALPSHKGPTTQILMGVVVTILALTTLFLGGSALWMGRVLGHRQIASGSTDRAQAISAERQILERAQSSLAVQKSAADSATASSPSDESSQKWVVSGIVEGSGEPYALINGAVVGIGDRIGNATLLSISKGTVRLRHDNGLEQTLRVSR